MKKPLIFLGAAILVGIVVFSIVKRPAATPTQDKPLVVGFENDVPTFDPLRLSNIFALRSASQVFEGLTHLDESNQIAGGVAESWTHSPDLTTWTFRLRAGVKFHPHPALTEATRELTAADVVYSFTRMLSKDAVTAGPLASVLKGAKEYQEGKSPAVSGLRVVSLSGVTSKPASWGHPKTSHPERDGRVIGSWVRWARGKTKKDKAAVDGRSYSSSSRSPAACLYPKG